MVTIGWAQLSRAISALIVLSITIFAISAWSPTTSIFVCFLIGISGTIQLTLAVYGLNSIYLLLAAVFTRDNKARNQPMRSFSGEWPFVTVQLPIYNERYVIQRLLEHCIQLEYPHDRLEIQVLDDSTDGTSDIVKAHVDELRKRTNIKLVHITRHSRSNFKAGALVLGTSQARGEYLAIFDADFTPDSDFLKQTIPHFSDEKVGCVQCRWGHLNDDHSLITKLQAIGHDGHFVIEQFAKCKSGFTLNFNGTAGVWRRQCIIDAGDWSGDTLAEDLDLSYRAQLKGWRIEYLRHVEVKAEVPLSISAFKKQQARWAKGSIQTAMKLLPRVWDSNQLTNMQKIQATIHLCGYSVHPMMLFNLCATCCLFFLSTSSAVDHIMPIVILAAVGPPAEVAYAQLWLGKPGYILLMPLLILLHHGLCLSNSSAVIEAFQGVTGSFERTPKFGTLQNDARWAATSYARPLRALAMPLGEIMMALLLAGVIALSFMGDFNVNYYTYPWLIFFLAGYLMIITFHVQENSEVDRAEKKRVSAADESNAEETTASAARDRKRK